MIHSLLLARKDDEFPSDYRFLDERFFPRELDELDEESLPLDDDELDEYDDELAELPLALPLLDELDDPDVELSDDEPSDDEPSDDELDELDDDARLDRRRLRFFFFSPNAALNRRSSTPAPSGTSSNCSSANFCRLRGIAHPRRRARAAHVRPRSAAALVRPHAPSAGTSGTSPSRARPRLARACPCPG